MSPEPRDPGEYDYNLPEGRIRLVPPVRREDSRLMVVPRKETFRDTIRFGTIADLPAILRPGDRLVVNDSRVVPARVWSVTSRGRRVELLFLGPFDSVSRGPVRFLGKGLRPGTELPLFSGRGNLLVGEYDEKQGCFSGEYRGERPVPEELESEGEMPLPPYIARKRPANSSDRDRYQTVFSRIPGSVAAPTAGLHLSDPLIKELEDRGVAVSRVTLHVGLGTFRPLGDGTLEDHRMHSEWYFVPEETAREIDRTKRAGGRVIAVGTTSVRALESSCRIAGETGEKRVVSGSGWTDLFIRPGYAFGPVDGLLTNFHTPRSTLLVLVDTFLGGNRWRPLYDKALNEGFMFLSYGDAMLIL